MANENQLIIQVQGRFLTRKEIDEIKALIAEYPDWSRWRLSIHLSRIWDWRNSRGQLKDMACRSLLLKLPARRRQSPNRMRTKVIQPVLHSTAPIECDLKELRPLEIISLSKASHSSYQPLFDFLLFKYHYLSYKGSVGENLKYLVFDRFNRPLCCLLFGSSAWKVSCRDEFIGWDTSIRQRNINYITNNMRFLILPWVRVYNLASHILGRICGRIGLDWGKKYGHEIYLLETFVERDRFLGTSYKTANWICVGQTAGRSRNDRYMSLKVPVKDVYVYPLVRNFRKHLTICI